MEVKLKYRGRMISAQDVAFIQGLIDKHPEASRRRLSAMRCEHWGWVQLNGQLPDRVWRSMMLELHRAGANRPRKEILGYPLDWRLRTLLCELR